jgi:hypothetical protein
MISNKNTKECFKMFTFIFLINTNLVKLSYGWLRIELHHKIGKNIDPNWKGWKDGWQSMIIMAINNICYW